VRRRLLSALVLLAAVSSACGYEVVRYRQALGDVHRVSIRAFENDSFDPAVDDWMTEALQREFLRRGAVKLVDDPRSADLVITGTVRNVDTVSRSFSSIEFALEYEVRMFLELSVTRPDGTQVLIDPRALAESELYLASADVETARTNREEALRRLSTALAGRIHDALYERISP
jgi:hypothetical protein